MRRGLITVLIIAVWIPAYTQELTLADIWKNGTYRQESVRGLRSMEDGLQYTVLETDRGGKTINRYEYATGDKKGQVLAENTLKDLTGDPEAKIEDYRFSSDERYLVISSDVERIYRHSTKEKYYIVDVLNKQARLLSEDGKQRHATISPDGLNIAYIKGNDLFMQDYQTSKETQVTKDGKANSIINGYADWVYEEEFTFDKAFFWSPDGKKIAFYRFDETEVPEFHMPKYGDLYPEDYTFKYPKAGEKNSKVTIMVYDIGEGLIHKLDLGDYEYIPRIKWTKSSGLLAVMKMPRLQNKLDIDLVNTQDYTAKTVYSESSDTYIEISDDLTFFGENEGFIWRTEKDGYYHLYSYDMEGQNEKQLTSGPWDVRTFLGYDEGSSWLYFSGSMDQPYDNGIFRINLNGAAPEPISPPIGSNRASFSKGFKYFMLYHSKATEPSRVSLHRSDGSEVRILEENLELHEKMHGMKLSDVEFMEIPNSEGTSLNAWMMKPADFNAKKKYPVLMYVYGGPGSQTVTNGMSSNFWWHQLLCQRGYIVVAVDNRGTGARGRDFRTSTYRELGKLETMDQIDAAKWLASQDYVDGSRIGIWGWSYGGYMSSLCLFKGADVFKAAIAVAPVSNWKYYDNIYTERYMGLPQDNADGYDKNSPINFVEKMEGNYLLVHGTGDDNVHYQNSVEMVNALISADKQFDFYIYPDRNHGIYGGNTRHHLFTKITDFITENL